MSKYMKVLGILSVLLGVLFIIQHKNCERFPDQVVGGKIVHSQLYRCSSPLYERLYQEITF